MKIFEFPATLCKSASATDAWEVGGVASSFHRDLDGEAIVPDAVERAIPGFMAQRGADGITGGPLQIHHGFYDRILKQAIESLRLPYEEQIKLVSSIALPVGRVTRIWVDDEGTTHWRGMLSKANPMAKIIWDMLREKLIHLGVSLGGKIMRTRPGGKDRLGRPCTLITDIRLDEISITSNPALRLTEGEDTGAYITALAKSVQSSLAKFATPKTMTVESFLRKALSDRKPVPKSLKKSAQTDVPKMGGMGFASSGTGVEKAFARDLKEPKTVSPKGKGTVKMDAALLTPGVAKKQPAPSKPTGSAKAEPKTDVWGLTVKEFTQKLSKCAVKGGDRMMKKSLGDPAMADFIKDGALGLTLTTDSPTEELVGFVQFLRKLAWFCSQLQGMDDWSAESHAIEMSGDLYKALESFTEKMPEDLASKPLRPPSGPTIPGNIDVVFPLQYQLNQ